MNDARRLASASWLLLPWWMLATAAGFAVGGPIESVLGRSSGMLVVVYVSVGGTAAAALQWLALRRHIAHAGWWVATGIAGGVVTGAAGLVLGAAVGFGAGVVESFRAGVGDGARAGFATGVDAAGVAAAVLFGAAVGVVQWLVLQRQVAGAGWWMLACSVGWVVSGLSAGVTDSAAGWAVLGAVYGAITGCVLVWLLRRRADGE
ncbi:MAG: hypothetical protein OXL97_09595 [Chloroflexota bacterium]|nr:hypothetical protein [Chloroflexota bacterium]MDE2885571.1 hypothetical protein [Chloroflexota bacterium]